MLLSVLVALILTPVLCASLLQPVSQGHDPAEKSFFLFRPFFLWFDWQFFRLRDWYRNTVGWILSRKGRFLLIYLVLVTLMGYLFVRMPTAYLPQEDQGVMYIQVMLPPGSTMEQTQQVLTKVREHFLVDEKDAVQGFFTVAGRGFSGSGQNTGLGFAMLKDWHDRPGANLKVDALAARAMAKFSKFRNARVFAFPPPAVLELGRAGGFDFELQDRGGLGHAKLMAARDQLLGLAAKDPRLMRVRPAGLDDVTQYRVDVDWEKAGALGVPITAIHNTISSAFGSAYVNDFIQGGRVKRVYVQADAPFRMLPNDVNRLYVRNAAGTMTPFSAFATGHWSYGAPLLERFNSFPATNIWGEPAPGRSSGEAMRAMEEIVAKLPKGIGYDWAGLSFQERQAKSQAPALYAFSVLVIFLCVAALYESWTIPVANLLMLPLSLLGATVATTLRGLPNDVYFQIGILTTLGLSTKNGILIIQFARERRNQGAKLIEATLGAVKTRFRPVIMTSMAFFFGVLPLALTTGAGAGAQNAIGTAVVGGMLSATFIDLFFIPMFYVLVCSLFQRKQRQLPEPVPDSVSSEGR
jgi:hydrophobe/amphiphile efflux-1 (HAE1) family protein